MKYYRQYWNTKQKRRSPFGGVVASQEEVQKLKKKIQAYETQELEKAEAEMLQQIEEADKK